MKSQTLCNIIKILLVENSIEKNTPFRGIPFGTKSLKTNVHCFIVACCISSTVFCHLATTTATFHLVRLLYMPFQAAANCRFQNRKSTSLCCSDKSAGGAKQENFGMSLIDQPLATAVQLRLRKTRDDCCLTAPRLTNNLAATALLFISQ